MDFLIINKNKLKIMMTSEDMAEYGINPNEAEYENPKTRQAFWRVLDAASNSCGFNVCGDKLLIQFYPYAEGSELFVTKLGCVGEKAEKSISKSPNVAMLASRCRVYKFGNASNLILVSKKLEKSLLKTEAELYFCDDGYFYLAFEERSLYTEMSELSLVGEFATEVSFDLFPYIMEHSKKISDDGNAFAIMSEL